MATTATQVVLDTPAAEFRLPATDGKNYALDDVAGEKGTVVVFICNHCRPHGFGRPLADVGEHRLCGDLLERCGELSRRLI